MENKENNQNKGFLSNLWLGLIFIGGGAIILLNQMDLLSFDLNWWALFILLPAIASLSSAYHRYRATNSLFEMSVMVPALVGLFMVALAVNLLGGSGWNFNLNLYWPIILILLGLGMILGGTRKV